MECSEYLCRHLVESNSVISAASFCCQVAALVPDMFWNFYLVKNDKIANDNNSVNTQAREKIRTYLESLKFFDVCLTKFENYQILLNKICHRFLITTLLYWVGERASWKHGLKAHLHWRCLYAITPAIS